MIFLKKIIILALTISLYPGVACYGLYIFQQIAYPYYKEGITLFQRVSIRFLEII